MKHHMIGRIITGILFLAPFGFRAYSAPAATLVRDGKPAAVLVLPGGSDGISGEDSEQNGKALMAEFVPEQQAAYELRDHIERISGATLPVVDMDGEVGALLPIRIGAAADEDLENLIRARGDDPWSFALIVEADGVQLRGLTPEGTRTAAYELLEQLGVRWFMPGETGREIPESQTLTLAIQRTVQVPSFQLRFPIGGRNRPHLELWSRRARLGGVDRTAEVWVNGQWVGANHDGVEFDLDAHGSAFVPFAFDVTDAIRPGEPNTVTVRTYRTGTSELGTGGLVGPVMFYRKGL